MQRRQFELILNPVFPGSVIQNPLWVLFKALPAHMQLVPAPLVRLGIVVDSLLVPREYCGDAFDNRALWVGLLMPISGVFTGCIPSFALLYATGAEVRGARLCPEF